MGFSIRKKFFWVLAAAALLALSGLPATSPAEEAGRHITRADIIVAKVNGYGISEKELMVMVNNLLPLQSFHTSISDERFREIRRMALENIIDNSLIYDWARTDKNLLTSDKEVNKEFRRIKEGLGEEDFGKFLKDNKLTEKGLKEELRRTFTVANAKKAKEKEHREKAQATIDEARVKEYYEKNIEKFREPEKVHLRSILISVDPSSTSAQWEEAKKKAYEISKRARGGEDFSELAKKYSGDPFASKGGDTGWSHRGSIVEEVDYAVSKMKVGEVSDPIMTIYGYHIVKLEEVKPSVLRKYSEINRKKLEAELEQKEYRRLQAEWQKELRKGAKIEYLVAEFKDETR